MKKLIFAIVMIFIMTQHAFGQTVLVVRPPVKNVGASCTYRVIENWGGTVLRKYTEKVTAVFADGYQLSKVTETGVTSTIVRTPELNDVVDGDERYSPDTGSYRFPFYSGQEYKTVYNYERNGTHGRRTYDVKVVGEEVIDTPVGRLTTIRVEYQGFVNSVSADGTPGKGTQKMTRWILPHNWCIAKTEFRGSDARGALYDTATIMLVAFGD